MPVIFIIGQQAGRGQGGHTTKKIHSQDASANNTSTGYNVNTISITKGVSPKIGVSCQLDIISKYFS